MSYKLNVTMPISDENAPLLSIIAKKAGWIEGTLNDDGTPVTPMQVCAQILVEFIAGKVSESFDWYYGESQHATKAQVLAAVSANLVAEVVEVSDG